MGVVVKEIRPTAPATHPPRFRRGPGPHQPFPPSERIGGGPKKRACQAFSRSATPLRQPREMAEWVEFLGKYAHLDHLDAPFGGGGSEVQFAGPLCSMVPVVMLPRGGGQPAVRQTDEADSVVG